MYAAEEAVPEFKSRDHLAMRLDGEDVRILISTINLVDSSIRCSAQERVRIVLIPENLLNLIIANLPLLHRATLAVNDGSSAFAIASEKNMRLQRMKRHTLNVAFVKVKLLNRLKGQQFN